MENSIETVNMNGEPGDNGGRQRIEKRMSLPCTVTLPPSKTCTTSTKLESLWVSIIEDNPTTGVLGKGAIHDDMSWVIAKGTEVVWTIVGGVAKVAAKRTVVSHAMVLRVARSVLATVRTLILWTVNTKMPHDMAVKINSLISCCGLWAYMGGLEVQLDWGKRRYGPDERQDEGQQGHPTG